MTDEGRREGQRGASMAGQRRDEGEQGRGAQGTTASPSVKTSTLFPRNFVFGALTML